MGCGAVACGWIEVGGLGASRCRKCHQAREFGSGFGAYDAIDRLDHGLTFRGFDYPDETGEPFLRARFWRPVMERGVIHFPRPDQCNIRKDIRPMQARQFGQARVRSVDLEAADLGVYMSWINKLHDTYEACLGFSGPQGQKEPMLLKVSPRMRTNSGDTCIAAALWHMGLVLQPSFLVGPHLDSGTLVEVMPAYRSIELGVYAVYPSRRHLTPKVRALIDFLVDAFRMRTWPA